MGARPQLKAALDYLRGGKVFVVTKIDRLGRSVADLFAIVARIGVQGRFAAHPRGESGYGDAYRPAHGRADDVTVLGFHSSFRDWAGNEMHFPRELAERALAHVIGDKPEQAYRRDAALERRRPLMAAWAVYCEPSNAKFSSKQHLTSAGEGRERRQLALEIAAAAASLSL
jgi:Resolvase, N terminal domain